jgi:hypothetical protein
MSFEALQDGKFTNVWQTPDLMKGLRKDSQIARNSYEMSVLSGMVALNDGFQAIPASSSKVDLDSSDPSFPFPQVFVLSRHILYCTSTKIYEVNPVGYTLTLGITVSAGSRWNVVDFFDYLYASNGTVSVERSASGVWSTSSDLPIAYSMCNYNGQVLVGGIG